MQGSKLIDVLRTLGNKELKKLELFIRSPFFNTTEEVTLLFQAIKKHAPEFNRTKLEKSAIYKAALGKRPYDEKKLGYWMTDLLKLTERFLAYRQLEERTLQGELYLMQRYADAGLEKHYNSTLNQARKQQDQYPYLDAEHFYREFQLEATNNRYFDQLRQHRYDDSLQKAIDSLDRYYLTLKLKYSCEIFNRKNVVAADYEIRLLDEILLYVKDQDLTEAPTVGVYYRILMTLTDSGNEQHFVELKRLLKEHTKVFSPQEARDMYAYAQNYCIKRINSGQSEYFNELFGLYQRALETDTLIVGKHLSPWTYKNIIGAGLRIKEYDWVKNFIHEYKDRIAPEFRENAFTFNLATFHFNTGKPEKAMELLNGVEFTDVFYNLDSKAMLLRIYYEMDADEAMRSLIESFNAYIRRNKLISDHQKTIYKNMIKFTRQMAGLFNPKKEQVESLRKEIEETKQVAYRNWLLEKVKELG